MFLCSFSQRCALIYHATPCPHMHTHLPCHSLSSQCAYSSTMPLPVLTMCILIYHATPCPHNVHTHLSCHSLSSQRCILIYHATPCPHNVHTHLPCHCLSSQCAYSSTMLLPVLTMCALIYHATPCPHNVCTHLPCHSLSSQCAHSSTMPHCPHNVHTHLPCHSLSSQCAHSSTKGTYSVHPKLHGRMSVSSEVTECDSVTCALYKFGSTFYGHSWSSDS